MNRVSCGLLTRSIPALGKAAPKASAETPVPFGTMRALAKTKAQKGIWDITTEVPKMGAHEVMIRVDKSAICGTDLHIYMWDQWAQSTLGPLIPMVTGHEFVGTVAAVGSSVPVGEGPNFIRVGQRVSGEGHIVCGVCRWCRAGTPHLCRQTRGVGVNRQGCFAQYLVIPAFNVIPIPDSIPTDYASIFDPFGNAVHTALSFPLLGEDVLITGAGPIGCMAVGIARKAAARKIAIADPNPWRRELALKMGADVAFDPMTRSATQVVKDLGMLEGFDVGLEMSGNERALQGMVDSMANGGKIALLGIPPVSASIDWQKLVFRGLEIRGIYGRKMYDTWYKMCALLDAGLDLDPIITHRLPLDKYLDGHEAMESGLSGKVILDWSDVHKQNPIPFGINGEVVPSPLEAAASAR